MGNGTLAKSETAPPLSSFLSPKSYTSLLSACFSSLLSVDQRPLQTHRLSQGHIGYFSISRKVITGQTQELCRKLVWLGGELSVGLEAGTAEPLPLSFGDASFSVWEPKQGSYHLGCFLLYQFHRLPQADFQIKPASPMVPNAGSHSWYKCWLKSQNQKKKEVSKMSGPLKFHSEQFKW